MPLRRTASIVLRTYRVGEADKLVVFFTLQYGKLRGMARAARRPRSRFGGSLEIGTEVELTFFEKEGRELVSVDRCDIVRSIFSKLGEPILASTLAYVNDLVDGFFQEREPNPRVYRLLRASVGALVLERNPESLARYFEAWLLRLGGYYPRRRTCPDCGRPLAELGAYYLLDEQRFGCQSCLSTGLPISRESLAFIEEVWRNPPESVRPPTSKVVRELSVLHYRIIRQQLEKELKSHQVLQDLLREEGRA
jgi:DNA repair protein RecO (recombination protein O)